MNLKINSRRIAITLVFLTFLMLSKLLLAQPPENAALLYYQAFMLYESPEKEISNKLNDVARHHNEPDNQLKQYVERQQYVIDLLSTAADIKNCEWGYDYSRGSEMQLPHVQYFREITRIVIADAKILAGQGDYENAFKRCLTLYKMAHHISEETLISLLISSSVVNMTNECIQDILSKMPLDGTTLRQLKTELYRIDNKPFTLNNCMKNEYRLIAADMSPDRIDFLINVINTVLQPVTIMTAPNASPKKITDNNKNIEEQHKWEEIVRERVSHADEEFLVRNKKYLKKFYIEEVPSALELEYDRAYTKLIELEQKVKNDSIVNPDATIASVDNSPLRIIYSKIVGTNTFINAVKVAIEIYIIRAQSGRLPDELPVGLPKDVFSGEDFEYEKTKDGFVLRCRGKDLDKDEIFQYEFKVSK